MGFIASKIREIGKFNRKGLEVPVNGTSILGYIGDNYRMESVALVALMALALSLLEQQGKA